MVQPVGHVKSSAPLYSCRFVVLDAEDCGDFGGVVWVADDAFASSRCCVPSEHNNDKIFASTDLTGLWRAVDRLILIFSDRKSPSRRSLNKFYRRG